MKDEDLEKVKDLIKKKTDINCKDEYSQTPLMWATAIENKKIVQYLLNHGADVNYEDENGVHGVGFFLESMMDFFDDEEEESILVVVFSISRGDRY